MATNDVLTLPEGLPAPLDDGAAAHLVGLAWPPIALPATDGGLVRLDRRPSPRTVVYAYPRTKRPDEGVPGGDEAWNAIPGARGCTPQSCAFRDHHAELASLGAEVFGLSTQTGDVQREVVERLHLPFPLLSDAGLELARALALPTFEHHGETLPRRLTLILREGRIEGVFYPVFPPDANAGEVLAWLRRHPLPPAPTASS